MSVARGFPQAGHFYSNVMKPIHIACNFIVDPANGNGLGIRSLKSNGYIANVFMNTSATPLGGNPNPNSGYALIQFKQNFNYYLGGFTGFVSQVTGSALTSTTAGSPYVITSLGTTTLAQWNTAGLPAGLTPTVGQSFIAKATGAIGGTGTVQAPGTVAITSIQVIGDPNTSIANSNIATNGGAWVLVQFLVAGSPAAPSTNAVCGMHFFFDGSSVTVDGL